VGRDECEIDNRYVFAFNTDKPWLAVQHWTRREMEMNMNMGVSDDNTNWLSVNTMSDREENMNISRTRVAADDMI